MQESSRARNMIHVVVGTPDDDHCPICRAHPKEKRDRATSEELDSIVVEELSLSRILSCSCPMCTEARQEMSEE